MNIAECGIYKAEDFRCNEGTVCSYGSNETCNLRGKQWIAEYVRNHTECSTCCEATAYECQHGHSKEEWEVVRIYANCN